MIEENVILYGNEIVDSFNYEECKKNLKELVNRYLVYELEYHYITPPQITANYDIRYEQFTGQYNDKILNYIVKKLDTEEEVQIFYDNLYMAYKKLTIEERKYFKQYFINKRSEENIMYQMNIRSRYFMKIKKSCVIKMALYFNIAVRNK